MGRCCGWRLAIFAQRCKRKRRTCCRRVYIYNSDGGSTPSRYFVVTTEHVNLVVAGAAMGASSITYRSEATPTGCCGLNRRPNDCIYLMRLEIQFLVKKPLCIEVMLTYKVIIERAGGQSLPFPCTLPWGSGANKISSSRCAVPLSYPLRLPGRAR